MRERDRQDSSRSSAPLRAADDAVVVDTTGNTLEESVEVLKNIIASRF
jgi:cytidylate kinase